jgi:hypothetical protein
MRFIPIFAAACVILFWHSKTRITVAVNNSGKRSRGAVSASWLWICSAVALAHWSNVRVRSHLRDSCAFARAENCTRRTAAPAPKAEDSFLVLVGLFAVVVVPYLVGTRIARLFWRSRIRFYRRCSTRARQTSGCVIAQSPAAQNSNAMVVAGQALIRAGSNFRTRAIDTLM